jgi:outer membrane protein TolC
MTLDEVIERSLRGSPSLEVITQRVQANKASIDIADQFDNPQLSITKNTLDNAQAMSQTVVSFKQKIPYFSKRDKRADVAIADEKVLQEQLQKAKVKLVERIKSEAYTIWKLRELKSIIDEYIRLTRQNIKLYESYTSVSDNEHMGIMKAELSLSDLKVQKSTLDAQEAAAYARLSYLAATKVTDLTIDLHITQKPDLAALKASLLEHNPDLAVMQKEINKQNAKVALSDINNYPDFALVTGYAYREKFDNYFNVGFGLTLPIYGTEDAKEEREKALLLAKKAQKSDLGLAVSSELEVYYAQQLSSYKIYHIIQDEALPQVAHMFELSSSSIAIGSDLFKYIDVLFQKLDLEKKSIQAVTNYKKAEAKIAALRGDLR